MTDPTLGFVIGRHIARQEHADLCARAHASVRRFYPDSSILIVDDNSALADPETYDSGTSIVQSTFPGSGEFGLYYYYHLTRPFDRAVLLHDSMVINRPLDLGGVASISCLWHFTPFMSLDVLGHDIEKLLGVLDDKDTAIRKYRSLAWAGMFGCCCFLTWDCLDRIVQRHQLFRLIPKINTRELRCVMERVLGVLFSDELKHGGRISLNGSIYDLPGAFARDQLLENHGGFMDKTWHGR